MNREDILKNRTQLRSTLAITLAGLLLLFAGISRADDWPQFRGQARDGKSSETGLFKKWPEGGPELLLTVEGIGKGYSSACVVNGTVYVTGMDSRKKEWVTALDATGKVLWKTEFGTAFIQSNPESRSTPTFNEGKLYAISGTGEIACLDALKGEIFWKVDGYNTFEGSAGTWGTAESPLIVEDKVYYTPGGKKTTVVALNKMTGKTVWTSKSLGDKSAYISPAFVQAGNVPMILTGTAKYVLGVHAKTGEMLWNFPYADHYQAMQGEGIHAVTPVFYNNQVYMTSGYNHGSILLNLSKDLKKAQIAWEDNVLDCHHGGVLLLDGSLYGSNWLNNRNGNWVSLDWNTGKVHFENEWLCKGSLIYAGGMIIAYEEKNGHVALIRPDAQKFDVVSTFQVTQGEGPHWAHPSVSDGKLFLRHGDVLLVYSIRD